MNPISFEGQVRVLGKPSNMTDEQCGALPIANIDDTCISCWKLSWRERFKVLFSGVVWLGVLSGVTQPPAYVAAYRPFNVEKDAPNLKVKKWRFGFFNHGDCWRLKFTKADFHTCTYFTFWRFFASIDKTIKS